MAQDFKSNQTSISQNNLSRPKSKNWLIIGLILIIIFLIAIISLLIYQDFQLRKRIANLQQQSETQITPMPKATVFPTNVLPSIKKSELTSLDNIWNLYTNYALGFSLKIPKMSTGTASCIWKGEQEGDHSYRPASGLVPVKIFEYENGIYISHEYRYRLTGETKECDSQGGCRYYFSGCEKEITSLELLQKERQTWNIISEKVTNDQELELFIKKYFYPECKLGEKRASQQPGVFNVSILGDGQPPEQSKCFLNYKYVLKYAPEKQRAFTWDIGQASNFYAEEGKKFIHYDEEMEKSFTVL